MQDLLQNPAMQAGVLPFAAALAVAAAACLATWWVLQRILAQRESLVAVALAWVTAGERSA